MNAMLRPRPGAGRRPGTETLVGAGFGQPAPRVVIPHTQQTSFSGSSGNLYHIGDICNSGILCGLGAPGTGTDRSLADFTSAAVDSNGCPFFSFAGNPGGDTPQGPGLGYSGTTLNYVTKQTSNCFTTGLPANTPEAPLAAGLVLMGGAVAVALGLRRRRIQGR